MFACCSRTSTGLDVAGRCTSKCSCVAVANRMFVLLNAFLPVGKGTWAPADRSDVVICWHVHCSLPSTDSQSAWLYCWDTCDHCIALPENNDSKFGVSASTVCSWWHFFPQVHLKLIGNQQSCCHGLRLVCSIVHSNTACLMHSRSSAVTLARHRLKHNRCCRNQGHNRWAGLCDHHFLHYAVTLACSMHVWYILAAMNAPEGT